MVIGNLTEHGLIIVFPYHLVVVRQHIEFARQIYRKSRQGYILHLFKNPPTAKAVPPPLGKEGFARRALQEGLSGGNKRPCLLVAEGNISILRSKNIECEAHIEFAKQTYRKSRQGFILSAPTDIFITLFPQKRIKKALNKNCLVPVSPQACNNPSRFFRFNIRFFTLYFHYDG